MVQKKNKGPLVICKEKLKYAQSIKDNVDNLIKEINKEINTEAKKNSYKYEQSYIKKYTINKEAVVLIGSILNDVNKISSNYSFCPFIEGVQYNKDVHGPQIYTGAQYKSGAPFFN